MSWSVGPLVAGPADDRPALAQLDASHLALAFSESFDDGSGVANASRVRVIVLDTASPGPVDLQTAAMPEAWTSSQSQPNLAAAHGQVYVAWRTAPLPGDAAGEELWLRPLTWTGTALSFDAATPPLPLPRQDVHRPGDQRRPAIASSTMGGAALSAAWEDWGQTFGNTMLTADVVFESIPTPLARLP